MDLWRSFCLYSFLPSVTLPQNFQPPHPLWAPICASSAQWDNKTLLAMIFPVGMCLQQKVSWTIIGLTLFFPFSQASQSGTSCCLTPENSCLIYLVQFSRCLQWEGISGSCYSLMAGNWNPLYYAWLSSERMK